MLCLAMAVATVAAGRGASGPSGPAPRGPDPAAIQALYSVDFEPARESFQRMTVENPNDPEGWNLLASSIWLNIVFRQEKLNLDSFSGDALGTEDSNEIVSGEEEAELRRTLDRAMAAAEAILERDPKNLEARYQLGVAYGTLATFEALGKKSYLAANSAARKARKLHIEVLRQDPSFNDARLVVGAYDYTVGVIPGWLRFFLAPLGIRGDKDEGIQQLEWAADLGDRARTNARMVLVVVYNREKEYDRALDLLEELHASYPRNYLIEMAIGGVYERERSWAAAIETYRTVLAKMDAGIDDYDRFDAPPVMFKLAETNMHAEQFSEAIPLFEELSVDPTASDGMRCRAHMRAGRLLEDRDDARAASHFRAIQQLPCSNDLKREARRYL